jgi:DNA-directed RNA polymerase sigma subunit (sigma70/sigma32)
VASDERFFEYLRDVRAMPLIRPEDERDLLLRTRAGDTDARKQLIESHLELAALLGWKLRPNSMPAVDAAQEANVILIRLIDDPECPTPAVALGPALDEFFRGLES